MEGIFASSEDVRAEPAYHRENAYVVAAIGKSMSWQMIGGRSTGFQFIRDFGTNGLGMNLTFAAAAYWH